MTTSLNPIAAALNLGLFYDFETTGLPLFDQPSEDPRQPHIVQVGAQLVDLDTRIQIASLDLTVMPDGWSIPDDVAALNGITTERALAVGIPETLAITALLAFWRRAQVRIAHNENFDARIGRIAIKRLLGDEDLGDEWKAGQAQCTARMTTSMVKCPATERMRAAGRNHYKTPNLAEAYRHFTGTELQNAHTAGADTEACKVIYFAAVDSQAQEAVPA